MSSPRSSMASVPRRLTAARAVYARVLVLAAVLAFIGPISARSLLQFKVVSSSSDPAPSPTPAQAPFDWNAWFAAWLQAQNAAQSPPANTQPSPLAVYTSPPPPLSPPPSPPPPVVTNNAVTSTATAQTTFADIWYDDDYMHFGQLIRISDWADKAWGVPTMTAGTRLQYNKLINLPYISWRIVRDPIDTSSGYNNAILMSKSIVHIVSRDGRLVWYCNPDGYVSLMDYATALAGDRNRIRATISDKHGLSYQIGKPLVRGYHWVKMRFGAPGGSDVTPSDLGLAWQPKSDASYGANRAAWEYGFEVQDVDWTDPTILRKKI